MDNDEKLYQPIGVHPQNLIERYILQSINQQTTALVNVVNSTNALKTQLQEMNTAFATIAQQLASSNKRPGPSASSKSDILRQINQENLPYDFKLGLSSHFPTSISKGKVFTFTITLRTVGQMTLDENEIIPLDIRIYNCEYPSHLMETNKHGQNMADLDPYYCSLRYSNAKKKYTGHIKVRVNEVTSHYFNGWVFIAILVSPNSCIGNYGLNVKPLVVGNIRVKSKARCSEEES